MANIDNLQRWLAFVPDIGNNRALPADQQLVLEVLTGLPKETVTGFKAELDAPPQEGETKDDAKIRALSRFVRIVGGPHSLGGRPVASISDYARICTEIAGHYNLRELFAAVGYFNSLAGNEALFYERLSGGTAFTLHRSAAKEES